MVRDLMAQALHRMREYYLLAEAARRSSSIEESERATLVERVTLSAQKRRAALRLWHEGSLVEGMREAREAFDMLRAMAVDRGIDRFEGLAGEVEKHSQPSASRDFRGADHRRFVALLDAGDALHRELDLVLSTERDLKKRQRLRIAVTLVVLFVAVLGVLRWSKRPIAVDVEASSHWGPLFIPQRAVDGDRATEWLLPDRGLGTIDLYLRKPSTIHRIKLLNGTNGSFPERAINDYQIVVYAEGKAVHQFSGSFGPFDPEPRWRAHLLPAQLGIVDHVRLEVKSYSGSGAALAEIVLER